MKEIVIFGAGGHAKVVYDIVRKQGLYKTVAFVSQQVSSQHFIDLPLLTQENFFKSNNSQPQIGIVAIGDNWTRSQVVELIKNNKPNFTFVSAIHPSAQISDGVELSPGTVVMANAVVNSSSRIGSHVIINTQSSVDHDCNIGNFASLAPGVVLGGNVLVGEFTAISLGAKIVHKVEIGSHTVVGAGSIVLNNIPDHVLAYGSPAKVIRPREEGEKYL